MEGLRDHLGSSLSISLITGIALSTLIPLGIVPFTKFLKRRKRSINQHLEHGGKKPDDYNFVVTRTIMLTGVATGIYLHLAAKNDNALWSLADATPLVLLKTFVGCIILRDFIAYWSHRILHSKLLYQRFHEGHHAIRHVYDDYDGYYIDFFETLAAATIAYIPPVFLISRTHVLAVIFYVVLVAFVVFSVNHCGRELCIAINIPFVGTKLVLYHTQHHDDHHVYRQGNYAECLPFWDDLFGSRLVIRKRRPLPAQRLWNKAQKILTYIEVVNAIMNTKKETD